MQDTKDKKTVGLLTMHRVVNFGSVLQAYATQAVLERLGYSCTIIDYQYPNKMHHGDKEKWPWLVAIYREIMQWLHGRPAKKQHSGFESFREKYLHTAGYYPTYESLQKNPPQFDTFLLGSDQTWNVRHIGHDDTFLLSFTDSKNKVSYAPSAARSTVDGEYIEAFKRYIPQFKAISVREKNTQQLVKGLTGKEPPILPDPTLLLDKEDWKKIGNSARFKVKKSPFILVYVLRYSFYPYPLATKLIKKVYEKYGYHLVIIRYSMREKLGIKDYENLYEGIAPEDFVALFEQASFVVTTSFHGTAFAINNNKPFYAIYDPNLADDRIISLLREVGLEDRAVSIHDAAPEVTDAIDYHAVNIKLDAMRKKACQFLTDNL